MKWIGLTGGIGSGKSSVTRLLRKHGVPVVDADVLAREVVAKGSEGLAAIVDLFGTEVLTPDGSLDRAAMAKRVFGNPDALRDLENIIHPRIQEKVRREKEFYRSQGTPVAIYDVPLLFEKKMEPQFHKVILVWTSEEEQIRRVMARDSASREEVIGRLKSQIPLNDKMHRADYVIDNSGSQEELEAKVLAVLQSLQSS